MFVGIIAFFIPLEDYAFEPFHSGGFSGAPVAINSDGEGGLGLGVAEDVIDGAELVAEVEIVVGESFGS